MKLMTTGAAAAVGLAAGYFAENPGTAPLMGDASKPNDLMTIHRDKAVELGALVGGALMQYMYPFTYPDVADGLVSGGAALLGRRIGVRSFQNTPRTQAPYPMAVMGGAMGHALPSYGGAVRGQIGSISGVSKYHI